MRSWTARFFVFGVVMCGALRTADAVRIMTTPSTGGSTPFQFDNIALTPDGNTLVANGQFTSGGDRVWSLPVPADPSTDTVSLTQLSTNSFLVNAYDVEFPPVISPDGQTILFSHNGSSGAVNTIYTMPITGEGSSNFTGLFGADPNLVTPGDGNSHPVFAGTDVYFINNNAGFDGAAVPDFNNPSSPSAWQSSGPDWDRIYKRTSAGVVTPVTSPADGDIDPGLFTVVPGGNSILFAPDNPVAERINRGDIRPKIYSIPTSGGTRQEIPIPAPAHNFSIEKQIGVSADGLTVFFIGDYLSLGKSELFSVPIAGGTPTRVSEDMHWAGDVSSFAISPSGTHIAYVAGQNVGANAELFLTPIAGGTGNSIRISDPAPINSGELDVSISSGITGQEGGQIVFSNDSSEVYYLGDLNTNGVNDLYVVDTTEKLGLVPSEFYFVGPSGGDFFDESNWNDQPDGSGSSPPANTIEPGQRIQHALVIDGDTVSSGSPANGLGRKAVFESGSSLEMTPGSVLNFPESVDEVEFLFGSGFMFTDATMTVFEDIFFHGTTIMSGGTIESLDDDIEFQDANDTTITGTTFRAADNILLDNSITSVTGATFESSDRLGVRYEIDFSVSDTTIDVNNGNGDIEDIFAGAQGENTVVTLEGASILNADAVQEGVSLVLDGSTVATLLGGSPTLGDNASEDLVDADGTITLMSAAAELTTLRASASDVRSRVINGLTGLSYLDDPTAWNIEDWDGIAPIAALSVDGGNGDFDDDGDVDGSDFLAWQRGLGNTFTPADLAAWQSTYGTSALAAANATSLPEPTGSILVLLALLGSTQTRRRT
ncbi:MAG: hypothetical protein AAGD11_18130 [Planctomycetota bacterium]